MRQPIPGWVDTFIAQQVIMEDVIAKARSLAEKYVVSSTVREGQQIRVEVIDPDGFSFSLIVDGSECIVVFGDWHQPFDEPEEALAAFEKCLSGEAQLRVVTSFSLPRRGTLEIFGSNGQGPQVRYGMSSIFDLLLFLFPKTEKVYRNSFAQANGPTIV